MARIALRVLYFVLTFIPLWVSTLYWLRYYLPIKVSQSYHLGYFLFALVPAVVLSILILGIRQKILWLRITCGVLAIPAVLLWLLSVSVVESKFKIH